MRRSQEQIIAQMQQVVPPGTGEPTDPAILGQLTQLTAELIEAYRRDGQLQSEPFSDVPPRRIAQHDGPARKVLSNATVVVTGGEGCTGARLIQYLTALNPGRLISLDIQDSNARPAGVEFAQVDLRDVAALDRFMQQTRPQIVLHLAAEYLPWRAEKDVRNALGCNIVATTNVIAACERFGVERCVLSSTGKTSRYFTGEVYAASKKFNEWQFARAAADSRGTLYCMARFTHLLENSSLRQQIRQKVASGGPVNVHAPGRYVVAQNLDEVVSLHINAMALAKPQAAKCFLCRNLGWPVETLEAALWKISQAPSVIPLYFQGVQVGYEEPFFRGGVDWSAKDEMNTLINFMEQPREADSSGDMIIVEVQPFCFNALADAEARVAAAVADTSLSNAQLKSIFVEGVRSVAASSMQRAQPADVLKAIHFGLAPHHLKADGYSIHTFREIIELMAPPLRGRVTPPVVAAAGLKPADVLELADTLVELPSLQQDASYLRQAVNGSRVGSMTSMSTIILGWLALLAESPLCAVL